MIPSEIFIGLFLIVGFIFGILYSIKNSPKKENHKGYDLIGGVKTVLYVYFIVLSVLIVFEAIEILFPKIQFSEFYNVDAIGILSAFGTVFLGAMAVIVSQRQHRETQKQEILDEIIGPLHFEIQRIKNDYLLDMSHTIYYIEDFPQWKTITGTYNEIRATKTDANIPLFYNKMKDFTDTLAKIRYTIESIKNEYFQTYVTNPNGYNIDINEVPGFWIAYSTDIDRKRFTTGKFAIFGYDPMDHARKDALFDEDKCVFEFISITLNEPSLSHIKVQKEIRYIDAREPFLEMLTSLESELAEKDYIKVIRSQREELIIMADGIIAQLEAYIES